MARKAEPGKKKAIIDAATQVFAQHGYAGTRIIDVARAASVGKGTIYEYFRSKEDLFFATFKQGLTDSENQMMQILAESDRSAAELLNEIADTLLRTWLPKLDLYGLTLEFWSATTAIPGRRRFKDAFQNAYIDFRRALGAVIREGVERGEFISLDAEQLASALIGSWDALLLQAWLDPDFDPLAASQTHMKVLLRGLAAGS